MPFRANKAEKTYIMRAAEQYCAAWCPWEIRTASSVDDVDTAAVETLGPVMESHERFPERANIGFMQVVGRSHIRLRVYERGAGNRPAAARLRRGGGGIQQGLLAETVRVELPGGRLDIAGKARASRCL